MLTGKHMNSQVIEAILCKGFLFCCVVAKECLISSCLELNLWTSATRMQRNFQGNSNENCQKLEQVGIFNARKSTTSISEEENARIS